MKFVKVIILLVSFSHAFAEKVEVQTNMGNMILELNSAKAPKTVKNFLRYVRSGHYRNTIFHRVIKDFMAQAGGYDKKYIKKSTFAAIRNEANNGLSNSRGTIAMARTGYPHSATTQFFINLQDNKFLDHTSKTHRGWGYTVFGKVINGIKILDKIAAIKTGPAGPFQSDVPQEMVIIKNIKLIK